MLHLAPHVHTQAFYLKTSPSKILIFFQLPGYVKVLLNTMTDFCIVYTLIPTIRTHPSTVPPNWHLN